MKKILFVIPTLRVGGAEQSLISLLHAINRSKYDIDLMLFEKNGDLLKRVPENVKIIETDIITTAMLLEFRYYFVELLKSGHFLAAFFRLLIYFNGIFRKCFHNPFFFSWDIARLFIKPVEKEYDVAVGYLEGVADFFVAEKVKARKKIGWIHTDFSSQDRDFNSERELYHKFHRICVITNQCRESFLEYYPELHKRVRIIENMLDQNYICQQMQEAIEESYIRKTFNIVSIGRLEYSKGFDVAIKVAEILKSEGLDFSWHIFGDGSQRDILQKCIDSKSLQGIMILEGQTENPYKYMKDADIIVQTSRYEGKSIVLDEAKTLCCPILVTNYPSVKDQISNNVTGRIVSMVPDKIADGIIYMLKHPEYRKQVSDGCRSQNHSNSAIANKVERLLDN